MTHITSRFLRSSVGTSVLVSALSLGVDARADEYDATFTRAIAAKERGLDTNEPSAFEQALDLFQQADRIRATKESKYELASVAARLRQDDLAVEAYSAALGLGLEGTAADKARAFVEEKKGEMAYVNVKGPPGSEIYVGARRRGVLPLASPIVVFAGRIRIRALAGGRELSRDLDLAKGTAGEVDLSSDFSSQPPVNPPVNPPPTTTGPTTTGPAPSPDRTAPLVLTIAGASVTLLSIGTLVLSYSQLGTHRDRLRELCATPRGDDECAEAYTGKREAAQDEVDSIVTYKSLRTAGYVGAGVGLVAIGVGVALFSSGGEKPAARAFIAPTPGGMSLVLSGTL